MLDMEPITRLTRDMRSTATTLSDTEARYLVDAYYIMQDQRLRSGGQIRAMTQSEEPHTVLAWLADQSSTLEKQVSGALARYTEAHPMGQWMRSVKGIGPILSAGLLAHIDITKAPTVGHIWRFAGLDPTVQWEKGQKRPWNATLKVLCWKIGESFVKVSGGDEPGYYGLVYKKRKEFELERNERGELADQAKQALERKRFRKDTEARKHYEAGHLPPAHIHRRATRYAVKLFLSHLHHKWYEHHFGSPPPKPYVINQLGHGHYVAPPE